MHGVLGYDATAMTQILCRVTPVMKRFLLPAAVLALFGCVPHTRMYRPSPSEEVAFKACRRDVFPDDVRESFDKYQTVPLAWASIIKHVDVKETDSHVIVRMRAEHHYFDWLEDHGVQEEIYFLSPRGEGEFVAEFRIKKPVPVDALTRSVQPGRMLIAYGTPTRLEGRLIHMKAGFISTYGQRMFRTDILDYGRPGQPTKRLKVPT